MEHNVVTLETAKKLKAAGYPQTVYGYFHRFRPTDGEWECYLGLYSAPDYPAPTAQELADQLPTLTLVHKQDDDRFSADDGVPYSANIVYASTMAEALASLYLRLQEAK